MSSRHQGNGLETLLELEEVGMQYPFFCPNKTLIEGSWGKVKIRADESSCDGEMRIRRLGSVIKLDAGIYAIAGSVCIMVRR